MRSSNKKAICFFIMQTMLTFAPVSQFKAGQLAEMLKASYAGLLYDPSGRWAQEITKLEDFDRSAFDNPAIGQCIFISVLEGKPVGLASWDPRNWPNDGIVGQNCILPAYRGKGYGIAQLGEVLRLFRAQGVRQATVTTSEHPFFEAAQNMYRRLGFVEVGRRVAGPDPDYKVIDFERPL